MEIGEDETVKIQVTASTSTPYQKTISCEFTLIRETPTGVSYTIEDVENRDYALLKLVNSKDATIQVTLEFNPDELRIDSNDEIYINKISEVTDGNNYAKKLVFNIDAETAKNVKFYKVDIGENYTYPVIGGISAITVTT